MNDNKYYVYHWINDDTNLPFYVGKGSGRRYKRIQGRNPWFENVINKHNCHPEIIIDNLSEEEAFQKEIEIEQKYRALGYELCNLIPCGSAPPHFSGEKNSNYENYWTEEQKKNLSNKMIETKCHAESRNGRSERCMCVETGVVYEYKTKFLEELGLKAVWSITVACKNPTRTANGFHFVEGDKIEELNTPELRQQYLDSIVRSRSKRSKRCMCVETGVIHEHKCEFLEELGLKDVWSITISCRKPTRTAGGFHFVDDDKIEELNTPEKRQQYLDSIRNSRFTQ